MAKVDTPSPEPKNVDPPSPATPVPEPVSVPTQEPAAKDLEIEQPESEDEAPASATPASASAKSAAVSVVSTPAANGQTLQAPKDHLLIKRLSDKATLPTRGSPLSAGYDLYAAEESIVPKRGKALVDIQLSIAVPEGTYGRIAPRSGLGASSPKQEINLILTAASKHSIDTGAGVIDADYRGPVKVLLYNFSDEDYEVKHGDRIAQLILERIALAPLLEVDVSPCPNLLEGQR